MHGCSKLFKTLFIQTDGRSIPPSLQSMLKEQQPAQSGQPEQSGDPVEQPEQYEPWMESWIHPDEEVKRLIREGRERDRLAGYDLSPRRTGMRVSYASPDLEKTTEDGEKLWRALFRTGGGNIESLPMYAERLGFDREQLDAALDNLQGQGVLDESDPTMIRIKTRRFGSSDNPTSE